MPEVKRKRPASYEERRRYNTNTWYDYKVVAWKDMTKPEVTKAASFRAGLLALVAGITLVSLPNGPVDFFGDRGTKRSEAEKNALIADQQHRIFAKDMPAIQKFGLSYIGVGSVCGGSECWDENSINVNGIKGNKGILGYANVILIVGRENDIVGQSPGEKCLVGSSYDVTPSVVRGGEVSAAASIMQEGSSIKVYPAATDAPPLSFEVASDGFLTPKDAETVGILNAYNCDTDIRW